jgi:putative peptide zinc metalloprotease protein
MNLSYGSAIKLHPLEIREEKKSYIVEDGVTGDFFEMPMICVAAINKISEGLPLEEIEKELIVAFPDEEVNIIEFVNQLIELEMVESIDGVTIEVKNHERAKLSFTRIHPAFGKFFFNKVTKGLYILLFLLNLFIFIMNPHLFPHYKDIFIFDVMFQNILCWVLIGGVLALIHEMGHILSIRSYNLPTKLTVGHRLFLVVLETDLSLGWKLSSRQRITLYLSGICFDNVLLFLALLIQLLIPNTTEVYQSLLAFIVLDIVIRFIYQCCVYMKTDFYYVLENLTGSHNLMENAKALLLKRREAITIFKGEKRIIYTYSVFYLLGIILSIALLIFYYLPQVIYALLKIVPGFQEPVGSIPFLDSVFVVLQIALVFVLLLRSWGKAYRRK